MVTLPALYHRAVRYSLATLIALLATAYTLSGQNVQVEVPATVIQGKLPARLHHTGGGRGQSLRQSPAQGTLHPIRPSPTDDE